MRPTSLLPAPLSFALLFGVSSIAFAQAPAEGEPPAAPPAEAPPAPPPAEEAKPKPPVVQMEDTSGDPETFRAPAEPPEAVPEPEEGAGPTGAAPVTRGGPVPQEDEDVWRFEFHGYLRAPMRVGVGRRDNPPPGQNETTFHAPIVPDDQYLSWQHTRHNEKDWAEMFFSYGNSLVKGTVALQGFNFTDAAWKEDAAQFGISQGWVTITPDLPYENLRMSWKVGSFWNRYGTAGKYDAGEYDTYLFGRTHVMGETLRLEIDVSDFTLGAEHGIGAKRPNPSIYNTARFTLLNHMHGDIRYNDFVTLGVHHLFAWAQEEDRFGAGDGDDEPGQPDGAMAVYGAELRLDANMFGYLYLGYSHIAAEDAVTIAPAIEVLHAYGGGEFTLGVTENYLDSPGCSPVRPGQPRAPDRCSGGNGGVDSVLLQYEIGLANLLQGLESGETFFSGGRDLSLVLYGMYNSISSLDPAMDGVSRLKYGADLTFDALPWFGVALRADRVQPHSEIPEQSFSILSPRLLFRTAFVTREEIQIGYSRYFYDQRTCDTADTSAGPDLSGPADGNFSAGDERCVQPASAPVLPDGFGATAGNQDINTRGAPTQRPDINVFKIQASMWW